MAWLGMSIPTLPGSSKRPRTQHPGLKNIEAEKALIPKDSPAKPRDKPLIKPASKRKLPKPSKRGKNNNRD